MDALEVAERSKTSQSLRAAEVGQLRKALRGHIVLPGAAGYNEARQVWNGMVDKRPAAIIYCAGSADVIETVNFASSQNLKVAVRSGGHNVAGLSVCDAGVVIDLSRMKDVQVDRERRVAHAAAGLNLGEFDQATLACGLATTMGVNSDTGIAGLTLAEVSANSAANTG
jgi:FAD/FMN-containing dehydrogenase